MLLFFAMNLYTNYMSAYIQYLGGSPQEIGFVTSLSSFTALIIVPIAGYLADNYGRVKLIASSFYIRSITYLTYALSTNWVMLGVGTFYDGLTQYNHAAQSAIMADSLPPKQRALGFSVLQNFPNLMSILGPPVGAYLITAYGLSLGMQYCFIFSMVSMSVIGFMRQKLMTETFVKPESASKEKLWKQVPHIIKESYKSCYEVIKWTPKSLAILVLITAITSFAGAAVGPYWILYVKDEIGLSIADWGYILFLQGLLTLVLSIPAGIVVGKVGNKKIITIMLLLSLFHGFFFVYFCKTFLQVLAVMMYIGVITSFIVPASFAMLSDMIPRPMRARVTSAYGRGDAIGIQGGAGGAGGGYVITVPVLIGNIVGGVLYAINPTLPWIEQAGMLFVCLLISIFFLKEPKQQEI